MFSNRTTQSIRQRTRGPSDKQRSHPIVRKKTLESIYKCIQLGFDSLIKAPPSSGKSRGAFKAVKQSNYPAVYLSPRKDLYQQAREWCSEEGLTYRRLPSMPEHCASYNPKSPAYRAYQRGISPHEIHQRGLCEGNCEYERQKPYIEFPNDGRLGYVPQAAADVLIGHPSHAHVPPYINNRIVLYDDVDTQTYIEEYEVCTKNLRALLADSTCPFQTIEELYQLVDSSKSREEALDWLDEEDIDIWEDSETHAKAEQIVRTVLGAEDLGNGYRYYSGGGFSGVTAGNGEVFLLESPSHAPAQTVLGLDAYPMLFTDESLPCWWSRRLEVKLDFVEVLTEEETREYVTEVMGIRVIQANNHMKPYSGGEYVTVERDLKLIEYISTLHDTEPISIITSKKAKEQLKDEVQTEVEWLQFSEVHSNNEFAERDLGVVLGSPHYGDDYIKRIGAFLEEDVTSNNQRGRDRGYGEIGNVIRHQMREDMVAQSILRFGRSEEINGATVYVNTAAIPDYMPVTERPPESCDSIVDVEAQIRRAFLHGSESSMTTTELAEQTVCSKRQLRNRLDKLELTGALERREPRAANQPHRWYFEEM